MSLREDGELLRDDLVRLRRELHQEPEIGLHLPATQARVLEALDGLPLEVRTGEALSSVTAVLRGDRPGPVVLLRGDMDALPVTELTGLPYASRVDGVMHACGHDGHMAMVLGAAHVLAAEGGFAGTVHLVFQPAEEHGLGAKAMIADGLFERFPVDAMYGLHGMPGHPAGRISTRAGALMASEDNFEIRVTGRGGHAARPQMVVDPIVVAAEIVLALQTVVARNVDPTDPAVVSCTEITTDGARNAIPGQVVIRGDTRSFSPAVQALLERRIRQLAGGICAAHDATCEVTYTHEFEPTVNDPAAVATAVAAARLTVGDGHVDPDTAPWTASEDFGAFLRHVPGCFALLGTGEAPAAGGTALHSPDFDFNDDVLAIGMRYYVHLVRAALPAGDGS